ncbi:MAG: 1-acyl-sn-glycerol-3-phosphate acyltransferase [Alphaproteobacteria bacterium]|jgi:1-acyl-sn-glycerol-3-phosphate acyltransferase
MAAQVQHKDNRVIFLRLTIVLMGVVLVTIPLLLLAISARLLRLSVADKIPQYFHRCLLKLFGVSVKIAGERKQKCPLIIVANHLSWLDIMVIGASFPCYFIAKSDIASWPVLGFLAKIQNTIFVNRKAKGADIGTQVKNITEALKKNKTIILFPEGTTSDGNKTLPFKSALLAAAKKNDDYQAYVQTLCLNYHEISGMPVHRKQKPYIAWYGDMGLLSHVKDVLSQSPITVQLCFGSCILYDAFETRQKMAKYLENSIRSTYTQRQIAS